MDADLNLSIIVAVSENGVIGVGGELPWNLKTDLKRFADLTKGHMVIVGRKTHESILRRLGHHLKGRKALVITRQKDYSGLASAIEVFHSWSETLSSISGVRDEMFVIGGSEVYNWALPFANTIYLTRVHAEFEGNAFFPPFNPEEWTEVSRETYEADEKNSHPFSFIVLKRRQRGDFVTMEHARLDEQRLVMEEILNQGICPFCRENLEKFHRRPILKETECWLLTENQWPYENTRIHLLAILKYHAESIGELSGQAGRELIEIAGEVEEEYGLKSGALTIGMRFGDPERSGATVRHLHAQLIAAKITDKDNPLYRPVRFRAG